MKTIITILILFVSLGTYGQDRATNSYSNDGTMQSIMYDIENDLSHTRRIEIYKRGSLVNTIKPLEVIGHDWGVTAWHFSNDNKKLYFGSLENMYEYDIASGSIKRMFKDAPVPLTLSSVEPDKLILKGVYSHGKSKQQCKEMFVRGSLEDEGNWSRNDDYYTYSKGEYRKMCK